jgi:hypothetical protein
MLLGLAVMFFTPNSLVEMRLFPLVSGSVGAYRPYFPAGRFPPVRGGEDRAFPAALPVAMILLFILLPALHFLNDKYPLSPWG